MFGHSLPARCRVLREMSGYAGVLACFWSGGAVSTCTYLSLASDANSARSHLFSYNKDCFEWGASCGNIDGGSCLRGGVALSSLSHFETGILAGLCKKNHNLSLTDLLCAANARFEPLTALTHACLLEAFQTLCRLATPTPRATYWCGSRLLSRQVGTTPPSKAGEDTCVPGHR